MENNNIEGKTTNIAYQRFRRAAILVKTMMLVKAKSKQTQNNLSSVDTYNTFAEYAEQMKYSSTKIDFDPNLYKANRQLRVSAETKRTLTLPPEERTACQIEKALLTLRSIKAFCEYPKRMQKRLVEVCWYESQQKKKIVLRQGHPPRAFYFILSGTVSVKKLRPKEEFAKTICYLGRGKSFGELSIIHSTIRQATIITESEVELLCISKQDFINIFMTSGSIGGKNMHDPDFNLFVRQLNFLKGWPIDLLHKNQKDCLFYYLKRGAVLVKDSNISDWIYVIKSGSCDVLKKLRRVQTPKAKAKRFDIKYGTLERRHVFPEENKRTKSAHISTRVPQNKGLLSQNDKGLFVTKIDIQHKPKPKKKTITKHKTPEKTPEQNDSQRISILDSHSTKPTTSTEPPNLDPCFVKIATLQKGQVFGLQNMLHKNQPTFSLVSNGAEILMISKSFYTEYASRELIYHLEQTIPIYPGDAVLQRELKTSIYWHTYKQQEMDVFFGGLKQRRCRTAHI